MTNIVIQIIGWIGTILIVTAFFLNEQGKIKSKSRAYQVVNLFGAMFIGVNVLYQRAWPALGLQFVWGLIAIFELIKITLRKSPRA
ncbi:MAG: hypothetical protein AAB467_01100 [Patescibacteria group bacterium]